jgi:hypothetical protein
MHELALQKAQASNCGGAPSFFPRVSVPADKSLATARKKPRKVAKGAAGTLPEGPIRVAKKSVTLK